MYSLLGVNGFTLDPSIGEFVLTHPNVKIPPRGKTYSFNEARSPWWSKGLQDYVTDAKLGLVASGQTHTSRFNTIIYHPALHCSEYINTAFITLYACMYVNEAFNSSKKSNML
jgi:hypothetical protein